jgi:hypothetical protein
VRVARERLDAGKRYRQVLREPTWTQSENQYEGHHWKKTDSSDDHIVVNYSFGNVNVIVPYMTGSDPNFLIQPYGNGATPRNAALQQAFANRIWRSPEVSGQEELEAAVFDFVVLGDGYLKAGYQIEEKRVEGDERTYADVAVLWVAHVDPWDVWIDPASDGIHNARWVAHRFRMTREELEASGFSNLGKDNVTYGTFHRVEQNETGPERRIGIRESMDGAGEYAVLYEFYDMVQNTRVVFADGQSPLAFDEDVPVCPIVQVPNYRIPGSPYHMGDLEQIWAVQQELNKTRSQMITHRARGVQKFGAKKGALDPKAKEALKSSIVNEVVEFTGEGGASLNDIVQPFEIPGLSADVYNVSSIMIEDIYEISGVTEFMRGAAPEIRKTATEVTVMEGAANAKVQHKLRSVERAARKVMEILLGFAADIFPDTDYDEVQLYLTGSDAEAVANTGEVNDEYGEAVPTGEIEGITMTPSPDMWVGTYEVFVEQASTELRNPIMREQKFRQIVLDLLTMGEALAAQGLTFDYRKLITMWLEAAGVEEVDRLFVELPTAGLEPGRVDVELGEQTNPEILASILGETGLLGGQSPEDVPPDVAMGAFDEGNTGMLESLPA